MAVGKFVVKAVKTAMELRAGLSREQTTICDAVLSGKWHHGLIRNILSRIELDLHE